MGNPVLPANGQGENQPPPGQWRVPVTLGGIGLLAVVLFTVVFALWKSQRDVVTFAAAAVAAAGAIGTTYYASATIRQTAVMQAEAAQAALQASRQAYEREKAATDRARIAASLRFMERWNDPLFARTRRRWRIERQRIRNDSREATLKRLDGDADSRGVVQDMLNRLEEMALAVHNNAVDEKVLKDFTEDLVLDTFAVCGDWIRHKQKDAPRVWGQLKKLDDKWRA